ncbi:helix-turn-helix transcriptional regulator [Flavivirga spongiicola]|uniref:Helix-turn-helix transcriptional regulator n=1 Tax=Flavivirga spongiicola TaxID=421621 RepID=A0ABU7XN13_9FLAO|nr:helix-turn-helix transcriptional regulator [Flavivirga sp. MEBiC05379]MDO5981502.1 helix-turn-helix transcriptional regulator [Flavivirga sp. MEBiC05379]
MNNFSITEISRQILSKDKSIEEISDLLPCFLHINSLDDFRVLEADNQILSYFDLNIAEINTLGFPLLEKYVNSSDLLNAIDLNIKYLKNKDTQSHVSFVQRINFHTSKQEKMFYTRGKVLDDKRILNLSVPIQDLQVFNYDALKLFDNASFIKSNLSKFNALTPREILVCKHLSQESTLKEVALRLNISEHTVKNHQINIYKKLEVKNFYAFYFFCSKFKIHL